jgi:hypothetical protein
MLVSFRTRLFHYRIRAIGRNNAPAARDEIPPCTPFALH